MPSNRAIIYRFNPLYRSREAALRYHMQAIRAAMVANYYALSEKMMDFYEQNEKEIIGLAIVSVLLWAVAIIQGQLFY